MGYITFTVAVATVLLSLLLHHACPRAAARPLSTRLVPSSYGSGSTTSELAVAPSTEAASSNDARWRAAARARKWLPYPFAGGGVHYPGYYPKYTGYAAEGKPTVWAAPSLGAYGAGGQLGKQAPYADVTRQEQVAMWASLLNPSQRPTTPTWLPAGGGEPEEAHELSEPKALVGGGAGEGAEMDVPAGGGGLQASQPKWGFSSENHGNRR